MVAEVTLVLLVPIGAWLLYALVRRVYQRDQIKQHGILADATVIDVYVIPAKGRARMVAVYEYLDQVGGSHKGKSPELADSPTLGPIPGSRCTIRFDPQNPERSVWVSEAAPLSERDRRNERRTEHR